MNTLLRIMLAAAGAAIAAQAAAQVTFYEHPEFDGRTFSTNAPVGNFAREGFNDRASSVVVRGARWEVCDDARYAGRCVVLRPGNYPSLDAIGLNDRVSSVREVNRNARIDERRYAPAPQVAQITFFERNGFEGPSFTTQKPIGHLARRGFNDRASSARVQGDRWEVCERPRFTGRCKVLRPGQYASLAEMGLNKQIASARIVDANTRIDDRRYAPIPVTAQVTFYERQGFEGQSFTSQKQIGNFARQGFNDRASSAIVQGNSWEVCEDAQFNGRCVTLRPGKYPSLTAMGLNNRVSSIRSVEANARNDEQPFANQPFQRRNNEQLYEANVTSVHAVVGAPEQRCWVEREEIAQERRNVNVPGAIAGAIIGGILGHQVGGGQGQDIATAGGAVAGAAVGAYIGRDGSGQPVQSRDVQRCESIPSQARPDFWDVTYVFRGQSHQVQMTAPPGSTVTVNAQGEPRA